MWDGYHLFHYYDRYLKRKREHDIFISNERAEFDMGRQHLANMMVIYLYLLGWLKVSMINIQGFDTDVMTQEDIDESIEYLFPSGLATGNRW